VADIIVDFCQYKHSSNGRISETPEWIGNVSKSAAGSRDLEWGKPVDELSMTRESCMSPKARESVNDEAGI
jgi:hypothetical protein